MGERRKGRFTQDLDHPKWMACNHHLPPPSMSVYIFVSLTSLFSFSLSFILSWFSLILMPSLVHTLSSLSSSFTLLYVYRGIFLMDEKILVQILNLNFTSAHIPVHKAL